MRDRETLVELEEFLRYERTEVTDEDVEHEGNAAVKRHADDLASQIGAAWKLVSDHLKANPASRFGHLSKDDLSILASGAYDWLAGRYGDTGYYFGEDASDDGWIAPARLLVELIDAGARPFDPTARRMADHARTFKEITR
jgi:hypothetical protein